MSLGDGVKNNLKLLRRQRGYTQLAVQMKTGIEQALLSKYENGSRVPPTETLVRLADFLGSVWIICCAGRMTRSCTVCRNHKGMTTSGAACMRLRGYILWMNRG